MRRQNIINNRFFQFDAIDSGRWLSPTKTEGGCIKCGGIQFFERDDGSWVCLECGYVNER